MKIRIEKFLAEDILWLKKLRRAIGTLHTRIHDKAVLMIKLNLENQRKYKDLKWEINKSKGYDLVGKRNGKTIIAVEVKATTREKRSPQQVKKIKEDIERLKDSGAELKILFCIEKWAWDVALDYINKTGINDVHAEMLRISHVAKYG